MYAQHKISVYICTSVATVAPVSSVVEIQKEIRISVGKKDKKPWDSGQYCMNGFSYFLLTG